MGQTRHQVEQEALEVKRAAAKAARVTTDPATAMEGAPAWDVDPAADTDFLDAITKEVGDPFTPVYKSAGGVSPGPDMTPEEHAARADGIPVVSYTVEVDCSTAARVGANIKALREKAGLSRQSIGIKGLPAIEKGAANPTLSTLEKLASALGVEVWDLLKEE